MPTGSFSCGSTRAMRALSTRSAAREGATHSSSCARRDSTCALTHAGASRFHTYRRDFRRNRERKLLDMSRQCPDPTFSYV
eukprot:2121532-Pleurochrysis_carterae.AAC.2